MTDVRSKALWHTRHGLVRYFANISLMCDNCRLYEQHHGNDMVRSEQMQPSQLTTAPAHVCVCCWRAAAWQYGLCFAARDGSSMTCGLRRVMAAKRARPFMCAVTRSLWSLCVLQEIRAWADKMQSYIERLLNEEHIKAEAQVRDALYSLASRR